MSRPTIGKLKTAEHHTITLGFSNNTNMKNGEGDTGISRVHLWQFNPDFTDQSGKMLEADSRRPRAFADFPLLPENPKAVLCVAALSISYSGAIHGGTKMGEMGKPWGSPAVPGTAPVSRLPVVKPRVHAAIWPPAWCEEAFLGAFLGVPCPRLPKQIVVVLRLSSRDIIRRKAN